jgi:tetratricopeptide (TPR) repeat protein
MLRWIGLRLRGAVPLTVILLALSVAPCSADADMADRYLRSAERGDVTAQVYVGALYATGVGLRRSDEEAFRWFLRAADQGHGQAQVIVAALYAIGKGVDKSNVNAHRWASLAARSRDETVRSGANQLVDLLTSRMSTGERAESKRFGPARAATSSARLEDEPISPRVRARDEPVRARDEPVRVGEADSHYRRARDLFQSGEYARAADGFTKAIELAPDHADAYNDRCWTRALLGRLRDALADCNHALRLRPDFVYALDSRGFVNLRLGDNDLALADFDAALRLRPGLASALYGRGKARLRKGQVAAGNSDIRAAKAFDPGIEAHYSRHGVR